MSSTKPRKVTFKKIKADESDTSAPTKKSTAEEQSSSTFILENLNVSQLDRNYVLPEIARKQEREAIQDFARSNKTWSGDDAKGISTSLEKLGISTARKEPMETIYWGDHYKIQLFVNSGSNRFELTPERKIKCSWCHQYPPDGVLMLAVPYKFVSSYTHEHVYAPECVNVVKSIQVESSKSVVAEKTKKTDPKSAPKINFFKRDLTTQDKTAYAPNDTRVVSNDYFETVKPCCSFNCLESKGRELAEKDPRFKNVRMHITHLYQLIFGVLPGKITPASPCDILQEYGGEYTVEEYRKNFKFITHDETHKYYIRARNLLNPSIELFSSIRD